MKRISFTSDYMEGAHPLIMQRLMETITAADFGVAGGGGRSTISLYRS